MATRKPLFFGDLGSEEMAAADDIALGGLAMGGPITMGGSKITGVGDATADGDVIGYDQTGAQLGDLSLTGDLDMNSNQLKEVADGTLAADAVNLAQLQTAINQGATRKEFLIHEEQLDNDEGVLAAMALTVVNNPVSGDSLILQDGVTTRDYRAVAGGDVQYAIGGSPAITMQNIVDAINGDGSSKWDAYFSTTLDAIDSDGVIVIVEKDNDAGASEMYGVWGTQADAQVVDFGGEDNYEKKTLTTMQASDPASTTFGFNRTKADLTPGEMHYTENLDVDYGWDSDLEAWNAMSGASSIPDATSAAGGGIKGKVTFDRDFGLVVATGIAKVSLASNKGLGFDGSGDIQGIADTTAGMEITSSGFAIDLASNPGLQFTGGDLDMLLNGTTLQKGASGVSVKGLPAQFEIATVATSANVTAANLNTLTAGSASDADALHTHNEGAAKRLEDELTAEENLAKGDPIEWGTTDNELRQCRANLAARTQCFGVVEEAAGIAADATGTIVRRGVAVGVLSGATVGERFYVDNTGGLVSGHAGISAGNHVILVGTAKNATDLEVNPQYITKKAA